MLPHDVYIGYYPYDDSMGALVLRHLYGGASPTTFIWECYPRDDSMGCYPHDAFMGRPLCDEIRSLSRHTRRSEVSNTNRSTTRRHPSES